MNRLLLKGYTLIGLSIVFIQYSGAQSIVLPDIQACSNGSCSWSFWSGETTDLSSFRYSVENINVKSLTDNTVTSKKCLIASVYNDKTWAVTPNKQVDVTPYESYTFSVTVKTSGLGDLSILDSYIGFVVYYPNNTIDWASSIKQLPRNSDGWITLSTTYYANATTGLKIVPRFYGNKGGGEIQVYKAAIYKSGESPSINDIPVDGARPFVGYHNFPTDFAINTNNTSSWNLYAANNLHVGAYTGTLPNGLPYLKASVYNNSDWTVFPQNFTEAVKSGLQYTFTAVIAAKSLGQLHASASTSSSAYLCFYEYDASNHVLSTTPLVRTLLPLGSFEWKRFSVTLTPNSSTKIIKPIIVVENGGGEIYICGANMLPVQTESQFAIPNTGNILASITNFSIISKPITEGEMPVGWTFWQTTTGPTKLFTTTYLPEPNNFLKINISEPNAWTIFPNSQMSGPTQFWYPVITNQQYTFTIRLAAKVVSSDLKIKIYTYDSGFNRLLTYDVTSSVTSTNEPNWKTSHVTITIPSCSTNCPIKYILPVIEGSGASELYIQEASLLPSGSPVVNFPIKHNTPLPFILKKNNNNEVDYCNISQTVSNWRLLPENGECRHYSFTVEKNPEPILACRYYQTDNVSLHPTTGNDFRTSFSNLNFQAGDVLIFKAVVATRNMGQLGWGGFRLGYTQDKNDCNGITYTSGSHIGGSDYQSNGTWALFSDKITLPANADVANLFPAIYFSGGGELYLYSATIYKFNGSNENAVEFIPPMPKNQQSLPKEGLVEYHAPDKKYYYAYERYHKTVYLDINTKDFTTDSFCLKTYGFYHNSQVDGVAANHGSGIRWTINYPGSLPSGLTYTITYNGQAIANGSVTSKDITTSPGENYGYYELIVKGNLGNGTRVIGLSSAVYFNSSNYTWPGYNNNRFGINNVPLATGNLTSGSTDNSYFYRLMGLTWIRPMVRNPNGPKINGIDVIPTGDYTTYANDWKTFMNNSATPVLAPQYGNFIEYWNEPDPVGELTPGNACTYVAAVNAVHTGIGNSNTYRKLAINFQSPLWFDYMNKSMTNCNSPIPYEIMSIHPYTFYPGNNKTASPEFNKSLVTSYNAWGQPVQTDFSQMYCKGLLEDLNTYVGYAKANTPAKEMVTTEYGWATHEGYPSSTSELNQAKYTVRSGLLQLSAGITKVMAYTWIDYLNVENTKDLADTHLGFLRFDYTPKPVVCTYTTMAKTIGNAVYKGYYNLGTNKLALIFSEPSSNKVIIAAWSLNSGDNLSIGMLTTNSIKLNSTPAAIKPIDMWGVAGSNLSLPSTLSLSDSPVYIVIDNSDYNTLIDTSKVTVGLPPASTFNTDK